MAARTQRKKKAPGLAPGTLVYTGPARSTPVSLEVIQYNQQTLSEKTVETADELPKRFPPGSTTWINVTGIHDTGIVEQIGNRLNIHSLVLEDVLNMNHRPKLEDYDEQLFLIARMVSLTSDDTLDIEQVSLIVGKNFLISFQEKPGDVFEPIRTRMREGRPRMREGGPDYLAYALLDAIVDHYFVVLETTEDQLELLDSRILHHAENHNLDEIHRLKRRLISLRRAATPLREIISAMQNESGDFIQEKTRLYLRDLQDHAIQVIETVETHRETASALLDLHLSLVSFKMNEVMKVLTIMATIFIPLTFVVGIYGMNFQHMPELQWRYGYLAVWGLMVALALSMIVFFRRRKWL